jgi:hypothetical protein
VKKRTQAQVTLLIGLYEDLAQQKREQAQALSAEAGTLEDIVAVLRALRGDRPVLPPYLDYGPQTTAGLDWPGAGVPT